MGWVKIIEKSKDLVLLATSYMKTEVANTPFCTINIICNSKRVQEVEGARDTKTVCLDELGKFKWKFYIWFIETNFLICVLKEIS